MAPRRDRRESGSKPFFTLHLDTSTYISGCGAKGVEMRPDIPWNVAGIPPEAREAARAAARREGLSVGEWMTRRILRSFSGLEDELASLTGYEGRAPTGAPLDAWGL